MIYIIQYTYFIYSYCCSYSLLLAYTPETRLKNEDVVNSTTKYIPADMFDSREDVSSTTYPFQLYIFMNMDE